MHTTLLNSDCTTAAIHNGDFSGPLFLVGKDEEDSMSRAKVMTTYDEIERLILSRNTKDVIAYIERLDDLVSVMEFVAVMRHQKQTQERTTGKV